MVACRVDPFLGATAALLQKLDRFGERVSVGAELRGEIAEIVQHLHGRGVEGAEMLFHLGGGRSGPLVEIVHGGDELGNARHHRVLDGVHVLVRAAEHFLQQDVGLAQPLEQRRGIGAQHAVRLHHVGHRRSGGLFRLVDNAPGRAVQIRKRARDVRLGGVGDALGAFLELPQRASDGRGRGLAGVVDQPGDLFAVVHHRLSEDYALGLDRLDGLVRDAGYLAGELLALDGSDASSSCDFSSSTCVISPTRCDTAL